MTFREEMNAVLVREDPKVYDDLRGLLSSETGVSEFPEMWALHQMGTCGNLHKENFDHSIRVAVAAPARLRVRLIALCHDVGKAMTRRVEDGEVTFRLHEERGELITRIALTRLGYDVRLVEQVAVGVGMSGRASRYDESWSDASVRRVVRDADGFFDDLMDFVAVDSTSKWEHKREVMRQQAKALRERVAVVEALDAERARRPMLDGPAIMSILGVEPGPVIGRVTKALLAEQPETVADAERIVEQFRESVEA